MDKGSQMNAGVLYFILDDRKNDYFKMAVRSVESIRKYMPWLKFTLFTNKSGLDTSVFDTVIHMETKEIRKPMWVYKYDCFLKSPYDITLHLDADTFACDDFSEVFDMMERFDFVSLLSPHYGFGEEPPGVPRCFPEIAGGFMLWKKNDVTTAFWHKIKECLLTSSWKRADEPAIRRAMFEMRDLRFAIIPWEYTCIYNFPGYLKSNVKIMHGKDKNMKESIQDAAKIFNEVSGMRLFTGEQLFRMKTKYKRFVGVDEIIPYGHWKDKT